MKNIHLLFVIIFTGLAPFKIAAQTLEDNFGNIIKYDDIAREPWRIENTANRSIANTDNIYQTGNVGIGEFSTSNATQQLDVNGNARIRALTVGTNDLSLYPRSIVVQLDGTLGYVVRSFPLFQQSSRTILVIGNNTSIVYLNTTKRLLVFPITVATGAYDGRIIYVLDKETTAGTINTNIYYHNMTGSNDSSNTTNIINKQSQMIFACKVIDATTVQWYRIR